MILDIASLRSLVAVAEQGSFAAAGKQLNLTQSAITQQLRRLETNLGQPLLQKRGRGKVLTPQGRRLLGYARQISLIHDEAVRAMTQDSHPLGVLRIGCPHGLTDSLLPRLLRQLSRLLPGVMMETHIGRSPFLMDDLKRGVIDIAISTRGDPDLLGRPLHVSPVVWMCATDFSFSRHEPLPLVLADELSLFRRLALKALDEHGIAWRQSFMAPTLVGIIAAVRGGLGITARNVELLSPGLRVLGANEGLPPLPSVPYYLWSRPGSANPVVSQALEILRQEHQSGTAQHTG